MANKNIFDLPASGALVSSDNIEKQVAANGQNQKITLSQVLTFIENNATFFTKKFDAQLGLTVAGGAVVLNATGSAEFAGSELIIANDGTISIGGLQWKINPDGSAIFGTDLTISNTAALTTVNDIEVSNTTKGFIIKSSGGNRFRLKVDDAGNLGTEPA